MDAQVPQIKWCSVVNPLRYGFSICRFGAKPTDTEGYCLYVVCMYMYV